ncbi:hypothetical protein JKP88DRAFT_247321 [Tribonema minus]|uniref:CCHC-type domain-containing protein n=1 Tax=Tribonema minus TaxID=303371 RepID=A0A836CAT1_9STRA|nr:hypothetical protein JKP88DRAFT_247321 [Tribonema minus]
MARAAARSAQLCLEEGAGTSAAMMVQATVHTLRAGSNAGAGRQGCRLRHAAPRRKGRWRRRRHEKCPRSFVTSWTTLGGEHRTVHCAWRHEQHVSRARLTYCPSVADTPLQLVQRRDLKPMDAGGSPTMANPDANAYHRRAPSTTHWQPSAAAGDSQSSAATSAGPFIARNDLGSAAKASSSGDETLARGLAVDYPGTFNTPTRGQASIRSTSTGSVDGLFGHSEQQDVDRFDASPRSIRQTTLISGRGGEEQLRCQEQLLASGVPEHTRAPLSIAFADLQQKYAKVEAQLMAHQEVAVAQEAAQAQFAADVRADLNAFRRRLDRAEWCAEENKVRATNAKQLASHLANTISQHVLPQVDELQMRQTEVAQHAACEVQAVTDCVTSLTTRVDELMTSIAGLREAQATRFYTPASALQTSAHAELCERNLRALGSSGGRDVSRRAVDVRSMLSSHAAQPSAAPARSVASAPAQDLSGRASSSSIAATIPVHAHTSQPDRYPSMVAAPEPHGGDFASASRRSSLLDMLKPDARAQLDGAARQASQPHEYAITQTLLTQARLEEQTRAEALAAAAQREHDRAQQQLAERRQQNIQHRWEEEMDARAALRQGAMDARERDLDAQQRALEQAQSQLSRARADADYDADSYSAPGRSSHAGGARRAAPGAGASGSGGGGGGSGGGGGGSGGGGDGGGGGGGLSASSSGTGGARPSAAAPAAAAAAAAAPMADISGFDDEGYALMRFSVTLHEKQYVKTKVDTDSVTALTLLKKQLPAKFKAAATALRQKKLWPNLRNADDFGCDWFEQAVYGICNCITNGGGNHHRLAQLQRQARAWVEQGNALTPAKRDGALLEWLFHRIATFLEIEEPTTIAASLMSWSLRGGLSLKDFIIEFADAKTMATSLDPSLDVIVLSALLQLLRRHYTNLSALFNPISEAPARYTSEDLLAILAKEAGGGALHTSQPPDPRYPVFPTDLASYNKGVGGGTGSSTGGAVKQSPYNSPASDSSAALTVDQRQQLQTAYAIYEFHTAPQGRACFNCGSTDHGFVNCDADYNSANWDAAVKRLPWVQRFKPHSDDDFKQLCARARQGISKGEQDDSQRARRARGCSSFTTAAAAAHHRSAVVNSGGISSSAPAAVDHGSSIIPAAAAAISSAHAQHCHTWNQRTRAGHGAGNGFHTAGTRTFLHTCIAIPVAAARAAAAPPQRAAALAGLRGGRICDFILCSCAGITHDERRAAAWRIGASHVSDQHKHRGIARSRGGGGCPSYCGSNSSDGGASDGARYLNCHIDINSCSKPSSTHFSGISLVSTSTSTAPTSTTSALWSARNHAHRGLRHGAACTGDYTDTHSAHRGLRHGCAYAGNCFCAQRASRASCRSDACAQPGDFFYAQPAHRGPRRDGACAGDFFCAQRALCGPSRGGTCAGILFYAQHTSATCDTISHTQPST